MSALQEIIAIYREKYSKNVVGGHYTLPELILTNPSLKLFGTDMGHSPKLLSETRVVMAEFRNLKLTQTEVL